MTSKLWDSSGQLAAFFIGSVLSLFVSLYKWGGSQTAFLNPADEVMKLSLLVIRCQNINASKDFYETLGLVFIKEQHGNGPMHYSSEYNGLVFELYPSETIHQDDGLRLGFNVSNIPDLIERHQVIDSYDFGGKTVYVVADPDGRKIEISP